MLEGKKQNETKKNFYQRKGWHMGQVLKDEQSPGRNGNGGENSIRENGMKLRE